MRVLGHFRRRLGDREDDDTKTGLDQLASPGRSRCRHPEHHAGRPLQGFIWHTDRRQNRDSTGIDVLPVEARQPESRGWCGDLGDGAASCFGFLRQLRPRCTRWVGWISTIVDDLPSLVHGVVRDFLTGRPTTQLHPEQREQGEPTTGTARRTIVVDGQLGHRTGSGSSENTSLSSFASWGSYPSSSRLVSIGPYVPSGASIP